MSTLTKIGGEHYARLEVPDALADRFSKIHALMKLKIDNGKFVLADNQSEDMQALYEACRDVVHSLQVPEEAIQSAPIDSETVAVPALVEETELVDDEDVSALADGDFANMSEDQLAAELGVMRYRAIIPDMIGRNYRPEYLKAEFQGFEQSPIEWSEDGRPAAILLTALIDSRSNVVLHHRRPEKSYGGSLERQVFNYQRNEISAKVAADIWPLIERNMRSVAA